MFKIKPRVSRKTAHGTSSDTHRGGLSRVRFTLASNRVSLSPALFFPPLCRWNRDAARPACSGTRCIASTRPSNRVRLRVSSVEIAAHARSRGWWNRWKPGNLERWRGCPLGNSKGKCRGGTYLTLPNELLELRVNFVLVLKKHMRSTSNLNKLFYLAKANSRIMGKSCVNVNIATCVLSSRYKNVFANVLYGKLYVR